jgi:hypothetical protein
LNLSNLSAEQLLARFNMVEALIWASFGLILLVAGLRRAAGHTLGSRAGVLFLFLAASDVAEMSTGAWFRPWWLALWKATCVFLLLVTYWQYRRLLRGP